MPVQRKVFRIEQMGAVAIAAACLKATDVTPTDPCEILAELKALHDLIEARTAAASPDVAPCDTAGFRRLKHETDAINDALNRTKKEIAVLHVHAFGGPPPARVARELDAIADSAESATQRILNAAEEIDEAANTLSASLKLDQECSLALDIQDNVLRIFEACNFQDLTGQRISKVLATLKLVEEHVTRMMEILGGIDAFKSYSAAAMTEANREAQLHGPKLNGDEGHASQAEVDALFAVG